MEKKKIVFKKNTVIELNDTSLLTINGGTIPTTINETRPTLSNQSASGPACPNTPPAPIII